MMRGGRGINIKYLFQDLCMYNGINLVNSHHSAVYHGTLNYFGFSTHMTQVCTGQQADKNV